MGDPDRAETVKKKGGGRSHIFLGSDQQEKPPT